VDYTFHFLRWENFVPNDDASASPSRFINHLVGHAGDFGRSSRKTKKIPDNVLIIQVNI
jgi:hypothetical protein